jgi:hypothetical protein
MYRALPQVLHGLEALGLDGGVFAVGRARIVKLGAMWSTRCCHGVHLELPQCSLPGLVWRLLSQPGYRWSVNACGRLDYLN